MLPVSRLMVMTLLLAVSVPAWAEERLLTRADLRTLAEGGYTIFFRHAKTDEAKRDATPVDLSDCSTQRPLSPEGREQAAAMKKALAAAKIRPETVLVSPYCRCRETGEIAFGPNMVKVEPNLTYSFRDTKPIRDQKAAWLKEQLAIRPPPGKVFVIVSHTSNIQDAVGVWPEKEGEALVLRRSESGATEVFGRIPAGTWEQP